MKKTKLLLRGISALLSATFLLVSFAGCKDEETDAPPAPLAEGLMDISGFAIIREDAASDNVINQTVLLKKAIKDNIGADLTVSSDEAAESAKEILIGKTNRAASAAALEKLKKQTSDDAYIIEITENKIAIVGTTDNATARAIKIFKEEYVNMSAGKNALDVSAGKIKAKTYNSSNIEVLDNGLEIELLFDPITIVEQGESSLDGVSMNVTSLGYPKGITLQHQKNPEDNGKLIAHVFFSNSGGPKSKACFIESSDGGLTWHVISRPEEQNAMNKTHGLTPGHMAHIYELPEAVGKYPAGTLVFSSGSINYDMRSEIWMWYSTDCGRTWKQTTKLASGVHDGVQSWGYTGVWEPYSIYDNGYLYCFYSDDRERDVEGEHDQILVYRRTKDGVNWEDPVNVCKFDYHRDRPGMIIITKMGNGEFFMVYEYYGQNFKGDYQGQIYYKKTKDLSDWGDPSDPGTMIKAGDLEIMGGPMCLWIPAGGECGTLIVTGKEDNSDNDDHSIMISNDYGETWTTMTNPLPYVRGDSNAGKSPALFASEDGRTVYYMCPTDIAGTDKRRMQFVAFKIY